MVNKKSTSSKMMEEDSIPETETSKEFINFFLDELKAVYWAQKNIAKTLPKIHKATRNTRSKGLFNGYLAISQHQAERLEQIFELLGEIPKAKKCEAMAALLDEASMVIEETGKGSHIRDTGIILAAQKIVQYNITTYNSLLQLARTMGNEDIITLLEETLSEENKTEELLTAFAEGNMGIPHQSVRMEEQMKDDEKATAVYDSVNLTGKSNRK